MSVFQSPGRSIVYSANAMAATSHPMASRLALEVLKRGGNAVDAAISAAVLLGVGEPMMCGLGGDGFGLMRKAGNDKLIAINGSGKSPAKLDAAMLREQGMKTIDLGSPHSVSVPGAIDMFDRLLADHGRLGWAECLAPVIESFEQGVVVSPRTACDWQAFEHRLQGDARRFFLNGGRAYAEGEAFGAQGQAEVLRKIAAQGRRGFYEGEVAQDMVDSLNAMGAVHSLEDFATTRADYVEPIMTNYHGHELFELPPNGQGATALLILNILKRFDLAKLPPDGAMRMHLEAEATKLAYEARDRFVADPDHSTLRLDHLLSEKTADALAALIDPDKAIGDVSFATEAVHKDTIYLTVVDEQRNAISLIYSIFHPFGSGLASNKFGILFQNRGAGLNLTEGHPNELQPRKRPLHTLIPGLLTKPGEYLMPFGVMGGAYQAAGHARFVTNLVDYGMSIQQAMDMPRGFADLALDQLGLESGYTDSVADELRAKGHNVVRPEIGIGGSQAIRLDLQSNVLSGASDPRKDGCALGY
ncbi:MAG: gamma-glutamyltransferase family protein [Burkholderiaceae bacterium]